jgi:hypothetical protein
MLPCGKVDGKKRGEKCSLSDYMFAFRPRKRAMMVLHFPSGDGRTQGASMIERTPFCGVQRR